MGRRAATGWPFALFGHWEGDGVAGEVGRLELQHLAAFQRHRQFGLDGKVCNAAVGEAGEERAADRRVAVNDQAGAMPEAAAGSVA
jgi:hypothetical protein